MQLYHNNWAAQLTVEASAAATQLQVSPALAAALGAIGGGDHVLLTLAETGDTGQEIAWEIVKCTGVDAGAGLLTVVREQESTAARIWSLGTPINARLTAGTLARLDQGRPQALIIAASAEGAALAAGAGAITVRMPYAMQLQEVRASLAIEQTGGSVVTVDINVAGASILTTPLTLDNGSRTSVGAATPAVIGTSLLADDAELTIDVDQVGDGSARGLKVMLLGYPL
jgi:hypothetical protein